MVVSEVKTFDKESPYIIHMKMWAEKRNFPLPKEIMSDFCFMAFIGEKPIASVFLYPVLSTDVAMIGFPIANPDTTAEERDHALSAVVAEAEKAAKLLNRKFVISYAGSKGAVSMFSKLDYQVADQNVTQYIKKI